MSSENSVFAHSSSHCEENKGAAGLRDVWVPKDAAPLTCSHQFEFRINHDLFRNSPYNSLSQPYHRPIASKSAKVSCLASRTINNGRWCLRQHG
ncbi:hypothetical protein CEXT_255361 [Caerostris extrusa]|uniref:Uncharacterized protein n=1 Tax=Caerostris extrusa TaxID=172846 RepID=A0AAV4R9F9_CAEEX|nr:hypothetical protein CEXT_255361 [Caerostris extrusa]